ncbi:DUF4097 family beta strand repeat-containing protein [Ruoffia tabacinasalis]|uniref:DUF4097 family beta strand repeat-containing protein n=1 Tax=Ruoffia tabacinasalis TaxID=87458 RepID=UPI0030CCD820
MNEKERIIDLVKQNVISMEEALDLLEAASNNDTLSESANTTDEEATQTTQATDDTEKETEASINQTFEEVFNQGKDFAKYMSDYFKQNAEKKADFEEWSEFEETEDTENIKNNQARLAEINTEIQALNDKIAKENEKLVISKQRIREIEIFEELDDLTPEMIEQKANTIEKRDHIQAELDILQSKFTELQSEKEALGWSKESNKQDFKEFFNNRSEKFAEAATHFGKEASREGKKWGSFFTEQSKSFLENFNLKDVNVSFQVPWIKTSSQDYEFTYPVEGVNRFEIELYNGSVEVVSHDGDDIVVDAEVRFHGSHEETSKEHFEEVNTIGIFDNRFVLKVTSPKFSVDGTIKVPQGDVDRFQIQLLNGEVNLDGLTSKEIVVKNKNGDVSLNKVTANEVSLDLLNGDIDIQNSPIDTLVMSDLNGDVRVNGYIRNLSADTLNSDFYLTKKDTNDANVKIKTVSGDVKLSLPSQMNLTIDSKTTHGEVKNRLSNLESIDEHPTKQKAHYHRIVSGDTDNAMVNITTTSGDIFLKDSKKEL